MLPSDAPVVHSFPLPLSAYPHPSRDGLLGTLADRAQIEPFNLIATGIFLLAILHTFLAARFTVLAHQMEERREARQRALRLPLVPSLRAEALHFLGEIEVVFGLWVVVLLMAMLSFFGWETATHYLNEGVNYTICDPCGLYCLAFRGEFGRLAQNHPNPISTVPRTASTAVHRRLPLLSRLRAGDTPLSEPDRSEAAAARGVLSGGARHSWGAAGVVD